MSTNPGQRPATDAPSAPTRAVTPSGGRSGGNGMSGIALAFELTPERLLWIVLIAYTAITRFWDLGYRTQHHDEGIHTVYSWEFAAGADGYIHNPLHHGPFLFHANALMYQLFGQSDTVSRLLPALAGVLIVVTPALLRHRNFLGPWGALTAGTLLAVSPTLLYYTRFIRHDPYTVLGSLLLLAAVFRYLQTPERRWIVLAFFSVAFLLTNHEIAFAILLGFVIVLWSALVLSRLRVLIPVHLAAGALVLMLLVLNGLLNWRSFPEIPYAQGGPDVARAYYGELLTHPLVIGMIAVGVAFVAGCVLAIRREAARRNPGGPVIDTLVGDADQGSVARGLADAWRDPVSVGIGALLALWIYFGLFTTLFTNMDGIATGTYATNGTLLYWLGQHGVQRGEQPWFYFITEALQYEWLSIFMAVAGSAVLTVTLARRLLSRNFSWDPTILFRVTLVFWLLFIFAVLTWAGEKMPWLLMHIVEPAALVGGFAAQDLVARVARWRRHADGTQRSLMPSGALALSLIGLAGMFFLVAANLTQGGYGVAGAAGRQIVPERVGSWWQLMVPLAAALVLIGLVTASRGVRSALYGAVTGVVIVLVLFQVHTSYRLVFQDGDSSLDTMIYNTVGPDAKQVVEDVEALSELAYGDHSITISNDQCTNWPLSTYFSGFEGYRFMNSVDVNATGLPDVIVATPDSFTGDGCASFPDDIPGYTSHTYAYRWHENEERIYRNFALAPEISIGRSAWKSESQDTGPLAVLGSIVDSVQSTGDAEQQQKLWRLLMYREQPAVGSAFLFKIYVSDELMPYYNDVRYGE